MSAQPATAEPSLPRLVAIVALAIGAAAVCAAELVRAGAPDAAAEAAVREEDGPCDLDPRALSGRPCTSQRSS